LQVVRQGFNFLILRNPASDSRYLFELLLGYGRIFPECRVLCPRLFFFQFDLSPIDVKDTPSAQPGALQAL